MILQVDPNPIDPFNLRSPTDPFQEPLRTKSHDPPSGGPGHVQSHGALQHLGPLVAASGPQGVVGLMFENV